MKRKHKRGKQSRNRVSDKISVLRGEGEPQDQAVATALSMERSGRLRKGGKYVHARKGRRGRKRA
jgi:hypothetical protein